MEHQLELSTEDLWEEISGRLKEALSDGTYGKWLADVRGLGAMLAIELVTRDGRPDSETASRVVEEALARGLLLLKAGVTGNSIRVLVPLVVSDAELEEALDAWEGALAAVL